MLKSKIVVMTKTTKSSCPANLAHHWDGELFYTHSKSGGIYDAYALSLLLKFKYLKSLDNLIGDFCLMPLLVK